MRMPKVRLDVFHALRRISRLVEKNRGAFKPFMARLRDAFFIVNSEDVKETSFVEVICAFGRISEMRRLLNVVDKMFLCTWSYIVTNKLIPILLPTADRKVS